MALCSASDAAVHWTGLSCLIAVVGHLSMGLGDVKCVVADPYGIDQGHDWCHVG